MKNQNRIAPSHPAHQTTGQPCPTDEQAEAIEAFLTGRHMRLTALAGTGKTTTLEMLAQAADGQGQYLAYNKAIADHAKSRMPGTCKAATCHSLALKGLPKDLRGSSNDKLFNSASVPMIAQTLPLTEQLALPALGGQIVIEPQLMAGLIRQTVAGFLHSAENQPEMAHANHVVGQYTRLAHALPSSRAELASLTVHLARKLWGRMRDRTDPMPLGFDGYLKAWALTEPKIKADYILLDEAQDTNPVLASIIQRHAKQGLAQVVSVGDPYQQIYGWRGAINAMESLPSEVEGCLTQSFRFGPVIAQVANQLLDPLGAAQQMTGSGRTPGSVHPVCADQTPDLSDLDAVLCRTNIGLVKHLLLAQLAERQTAVFEQSATELERLLRDVQGLQSGRPAQSSELAGFKDWSDVVEISREPHGLELATLVSLVQTYTVAGLQDVLAQCHRLREHAGRPICELLVTTTHKAKGCEWDSVWIAPDFDRPEREVEQDGQKTTEFDPEAGRLLYVAATRARQTLFIPDWMAEPATGSAQHAERQ